MTAPTTSTTPVERHSTLTILFYSGDGLLERLIERVTHSGYCHVAILLDNVLYEELAHGLQVAAGQPALQRINEAAAYTSFALDPAQRETCRQWLAQTAGHPYNLWALVDDLLSATTHRHLIIRRPGEWDCSGAAADLLSHLGHVWTKDDAEITPADLALWLAPLTPGVPVVGM